MGDTVRFTVDDSDSDDEASFASSTPRLNPHVAWDPEDIDVEAPPAPEFDIRDEGLSPIEYIAKYGEREFLNYTARINKCSAGLGRRFVQMNNEADMLTLEPDEVPYFYHVCVTVLLHEMSGSYMFGGFDYHDVAGRTKATIISLFIEAFCDPGVGSYFNYTDLSAPPRESYFFECDNRRFHKVNVLTEALFHKSYDINESGERVEMSPRAMFDSKNVKGYRMWFMIADPNLCPTQAIIDRINANISARGMAARARTVSAHNQMLVDYATMLATANARPNADVESIARDAQRTLTKEVHRINREARRINQEQKIAERERRREAATTPTINLRQVATEVTSLVDFFSLICYEERCLAPNCQNIRCAECRAKMTPAAAFLTDPQLARDTDRRNDPWLVDLDAIDYRPIDASTDLGCNLNACLEAHHKRSNLLQLIDPCFHFSIGNKTTIKLCGMPGIEICPEQLDQEHYYGFDARDRRVFRVPFDFAVFVYTPQIVFHPRFFQLRMPWCVDLRDFIITAIECYAQGQRRRLNAEHSRQFFQSIDSESSETRRAAAVSEHWRRFVPSSVSASLSGGDYDVSHDVTASSSIPSRQQQKDLDDRMVRIVDVFDREGKRFRDFVARLRNCSRTLGQAEQRMVIGVIREEGRRVFQSIFRSQEQNTRVCKNAIYLLASLSKRDESAFHNISVVSKNMHSTFGNYIVQQYAMAEAAGLLYTHTLFLRLRWSVMRAAHCDETDTFFGMITLLLNECFFGIAGAGKTYAAKVASEYLLEEAIVIISSSSDASFTSMESQSDMLKMFDEMRPAVCPGKNGDARDEMHLNLLKEMMTSHRSTRRITQIDPNGDITKRQVLTIVGVDHSAVALLGNDAVPSAVEPSYWTRYTIHIIAKMAERYGSGDIASQAVRANSGSINDSVRSVHSQRQQWAKIEHALNVAICRQIKVGALPYPNLDVLAYMWSMAYTALKQAFPSVAGMTRAAERVASLAVTLVILHAIYLVFNSIWSPLIRIDPDTETLSTDAYSHEQLRVVAPLLRADEDIAIYAITSGLFLDFCPPEHHIIAEAVATTFGLLGTATPQYALHRYNNQDYMNTNYVNCGSGAQIIKFIQNRFGHNQYTAMHILDLLEKTTVEVDYVNPVLPSQPATKRVIDAVMRYNNQERTTGNPMLDKYQSVYHVSVKYVETCSPAAVLALVMGAMSHKKIQRRQVVIGQTIEKLPFLPNTWQIEPGTHSVDMSTYSETKSYIKDALLGNYSITREGEEHRRHIDSAGTTVIDKNVDPESYLIVRWLQENVEMPSGISPEYYTRQEIEKATNRRLEEWFPVAAVKRKVYPQDIVNEYIRTAVNLEIAADSSGGIADKDFEQVFERISESSSSSSSSSSSRSSGSSDIASLCASFSTTKRSDRPSSINDLLASVRSSSKRPCVRPS